MSVAWEIAKKLPKIGQYGFKTILGQFFEDFSGYKHARAKISTVLESPHQYLSDDTHKPYIVTKKNLTLKGGPENFKGPEATLNLHQKLWNFYSMLIVYISMGKSG